MPHKAIKPETRCECRNAECPEARDPNYARITRGPDGRCPNDAVRMVTVRENPFETSLHHGLSTPDVPMCEPCATWHEKGGRNA